MWLYVINSLRGSRRSRIDTDDSVFIDAMDCGSAHLTVTESLTTFDSPATTGCAGNVTPVTDVISQRQIYWSLRQEQKREVSRLSDGRYETWESQSQNYSGLQINRLRSAIEYCTPPSARDTLNLIYQTGNQRSALSIQNCDQSTATNHAVLITVVHGPDSPRSGFMWLAGSRYTPFYWHHRPYALTFDGT